MVSARRSGRRFSRRRGSISAARVASSSAALLPAPPALLPLAALDFPPTAHCCPVVRDSDAQLYFSLISTSPEKADRYLYTFKNCKMLTFIPGFFFFCQNCNACIDNERQPFLFTEFLAEHLPSKTRIFRRSFSKNSVPRCKHSPKASVLSFWPTYIMTLGLSRAISILCPCHSATALCPRKFKRLFIQRYETSPLPLCYGRRGHKTLFQPKTHVDHGIFLDISKNLAACCLFFLTSLFIANALFGCVCCSCKKKHLISVAVTSYEAQETTGKRISADKNSEEKENEHRSRNSLIVKLRHVFLCELFHTSAGSFLAEIHEL